MMTGISGALAREHSNDLLISAARRHRAREARRAQARDGLCGSWLRQLFAVRGTGCRAPATVAAC